MNYQVKLLDPTGSVVQTQDFEAQSPSLAITLMKSEVSKKEGWKHRHLGEWEFYNIFDNNASMWERRCRLSWSFEVREISNGQ